MDSDLPRKILKVLYDGYDKNPTGVITTWQLAKIMNLPEKEVQGGLIYLKEKELIKSFFDDEHEWVQKINAKGIDEFQKEHHSELSSNDETSLDLPILKDDFEDGLRVFISHKFVKDDQQLALTFQNLLLENRINGYLAERKREYEKSIDEKIKNKINDSDYLVALITKNGLSSPSVHQEIGYAIGTKTPVIVMVEGDLEVGVLIKPKEKEFFTRINFKEKCNNVLSHVIENGKKKESPHRDFLRENVYPELYDKMMKIHENPDKFKTITTNPWKELPPSQKLKVEDDLKELFEQFTKELGNWQIALSRAQQSITINQTKLGEIIRQAFELVSLTDAYGNIILDSRSSMSTKNWIDTFKFIIFDESIPDENILYEKLLTFAGKSNNGHQGWLQDWKRSKPELYVYLHAKLANLRNAIKIESLSEDLQKEKKNMDIIVEKIIKILQERI